RSQPHDRSVLSQGGYRAQPDRRRGAPHPTPDFRPQAGRADGPGRPADPGTLRDGRGPPPDRAGGRGVATALRGGGSCARSLRAGRARPCRRDLRVHRNRIPGREDRPLPARRRAERSGVRPAVLPRRARAISTERGRPRTCDRGTPVTPGGQMHRAVAVFLAGVVLLCAACGSSPEQPESRTTERAGSHADERVHLSLEALRTTQISTVLVEQRHLTGEIRATAVIKPNENRLAHVSPPIPGRASAVTA